jgi:signal transduction histidine kinase
MPGLLARLAPAAWLHAPRRTARLRLTLLYSVLFLLSGAVLLAVTYLLVNQVTAFIPLPRGEQAFFGNLPSVSGAPGGHFGSAVRDRVNAPPAFSTHLHEYVVQMHAYQMHELLIRSVIALGVTAILSAALGWTVAGRVLRPVRQISATARQIGAGNLHDRLSLDGPDDEFRDLAATLDDLLERLDRAFESQRRFVANASHELRTPLTLDRALLERALRSPKPTHDLWRATCERLLASSQQQDRVIEALLTLARSEAGAAPHEQFELSEVIDDLLLSPGLDIGDAGPQIQTTIGPAAVTGDRRLIERLVRNLIDNAIRYNQPSGTVDITTTTSSGDAVLVVSNTGPPVPAADVERLFQPFQRLAPNRGSRAAGTGLGLSIVKAIAEAHDASITADPLPHGGLTIQVRFPTADGIADAHPAGPPRAARHIRWRQLPDGTACNHSRDLDGADCRNAG